MILGHALCERKRFLSRKREFCDAILHQKVEHDSTLFFLDVQVSLFFLNDYSPYVPLATCVVVLFKSGVEVLENNEVTDF